MLENGIIEQSFSPFSSPVTLVTKRDKTKRFCIDYRKVNELISSDVHPLPRIEDILDRLAQAKYFSTADISSAYWQVPIHPDSRPLLAFATLEALYQPTRLPFGLKTSPQVYERAISQVLQRHGLDCVAHYFDDFIIYFNTLEEHQNHLRQFFAFCEAEKLQLNFAKCEFFKQSIDFLGYTITAGTTTPLTRNTDIIHAIKQPHNRKTLQSFLGAVNVYNKFIPEYARLRAPLNNLLKKDVVWIWDETCQKAFIDLKGNLTQHPILHLYKEGLPCQVYCDASTLGIAGILKQVHPDGNVYPVQYFSQTLRPHEKNYSISELECLAIVESVEKFRIYLMGRKFTIFSDHHALQWLKTIKNPSGRLFRWSLRLSSYEYEVRYIKGKQQYEADLLSRNPFCGFLDASLIKTHQSPPSRESNLTIDRMSKDIKQKVKTCPTCQLTKRPLGPTYGELSQPPEAKEPFDLLSLDTIAGFAKYGNTKIYLHVVVDHFSRYAWTCPSKSTSITTYQQVLKRVLQDGSPKRLLTDRAPAFTSPKFSSFLLNRNIQLLLTTSNNPQANGLCERLNATLTGKLRLLHLENPKIAWTKLVKRSMKKTRSKTTMIGQTHNQVPQDSTTDSTVAASLRALTLCLDQLLNRDPEEAITYDGDEPAAHFFSQLEGEPCKIAQELALLNKTYEVKESLCAVYPRRPSFTLQEFYELKCTSMAEIDTYYKNKDRIGLAINLPKSAIVQALSNGVQRHYGNLLNMGQPSEPEEWLCLAQQLAYEGDNTSTKVAQQLSPRQSRAPSTTCQQRGPYQPTFRTLTPVVHNVEQYQKSTWPAGVYETSATTTREKPSNTNFGSRTPPKLNEPTCTQNQHTPVYCDASTQGIAGVLKQVHPDAHDYEVKYLKGSRQYEADLLSRNPFCGFLSTGQIKEHKGELRRDTRYILNNKDLMTITRRRVTKIIVPPSLRGTLLQRAHRDFNHPGISQMTRLIAAQYYWDGMTNDIRTHVRACSICQLVKPPKEPIYGELGQLPPAVLPYELVSLDTISGFAKYGNSQTFLHVVVDHATRYAWAFPSPSTSILTYTQVIKKVMQFGSTKRLLTDRDPAVTSLKFRRFLIRHDIGQLLTTSNNPQANGLSERLNATITGKLKLLRLQQPKTAWTKLLPQVLQDYNNTPHSVTGFTPSYLLLGSFPLQLSEHVQNYPKIDDAREMAYQRTHERHLRYKARFDQTHRASDFEVGDLVLAKTYHHPDTGKLAPFFSGPYEILEIISPQIVRINRSNRPLSRLTLGYHSYSESRQDNQNEGHHNEEGKKTVEIEKRKRAKMEEQARQSNETTKQSSPQRHSRKSHDMPPLPNRSYKLLQALIERLPRHQDNNPKPSLLTEQS
ncbi:hypothetical protein LAZ67_23000969 [Cordylochernes scorpioides]|uniref:RNA-directed DNA polymerase n=1 Tax=Cordylochernes scorpioides TaxID=51811 RepID=A0ABY6LQC6_9ARAC|nr:hypothetical protein LAZ67_23000969 [Cordylochernes scorpioides]